MKKILVFLFAVLAFALLAHWLVENPGLITITWLNYEVTTSVSVILALSAVIFLVIYILRLPVLFVRWVQKSILKQKEKNKEYLLQQILTACLGQDLAMTRKLSGKLSGKLQMDSTTILLLQAMIAPSENVYQKLANSPQTELAGWKGLIELNEKNGDIVAALTLSQKALEKYKSIAWLVLKTVQLQVLNEDWKAALVTLDMAKKQKLMDEASYKTQKATLLLKTGQGYDAFKTAPWVPQAALAAMKEKPKKAESILIKSWENKPSWDVYKAYIALHQNDTPLVRYKKIEKLAALTPESKLTHAVLADSALQAKLWGQAKKELDAYLSAYTLTAPIATMMAFYEQEANHDPKEAQKWLDKIKTLEPSFAFGCTRCGHPSDVWTPTCPICNAFAAMENK